MRRLSRLVPRSSLQIGVLLIFVTLVAGWGLFNKQRILTTIADGTDLTVEFDRQYKLQSFQSKAKIAGVPVGSVTDVEYADERAIVTIKLDEADAEKLGTAPSAAVRPTTLLGGNVYIDLIPGGDDGAPDGRIPLERTSVPVELDRVLDVLDADARRGLQSSITMSDDIMTNGGSEAFAGLIETAPSALPPTGEVLDALGGVAEGDLARAVRDLAGVTRAVQSDTQLDALLVSLADVSAVLGSEAPALGAAIDNLPRTATNARTALAELNVLLDTLEATAPELIPVADELDALLSDLSPVLVDARPVVADLRAVTADLAPALGDLAPMTADGRDIIDDIDGEVVDRVVGPTLDTLFSHHDGGIHSGSGSETMMYQELGYLLSGLAGMSQAVDSNGPFLNFSPAVDVESVAGLNSLGLDELGIDLEPGLNGEYGSPGMDDPAPATVVVDTADPADNELVPPPSSVPGAAVGQDGPNPGVGGDSGGSAIAGDPHRPDGLSADAAAGDDLDAEEVAAVGDVSDHENSPWKIPVVTIIAIAALIGWVLAYDSFRRRVKQ